MWAEDKQKLIKTFTFSTFSQAMGFMFQVALIAEKMDHHPTWSNTYNKVSFELSTHSDGNTITEKDRKLAFAIDSTWEKNYSK